MEITGERKISLHKTRRMATARKRLAASLRAIGKSFMRVSPV
jgi:hypothetical protein